MGITCILYFEKSDMVSTRVAVHIGSPLTQQNYTPIGALTLNFYNILLIYM